jgi:hypothetical protein
MKNKRTITNIIRIVVIIIIIILVGVFSLSYTINKNDNYQEKLIKTISDNYQVDDSITYANLYNNYYVFTTKNNVIVLNKEYKEVEKKDINDLASNTNNYELVYKTKKLMYENTIIKKNKVIYEYYDAKTYKKIATTTLEK